MNVLFGLFAVIGVFLGAFGIAAVVVLLRAWVFTWCWEWFVLPQFPGVWSMHLLTAWGLLLTINLALIQFTPVNKDNNLWWVGASCSSLLALLIAYVIHLFM